MADNSQTDDISWVTAGTGWEAYKESLDTVQFDIVTGNVLYPDAEDIVVLAKFEFEKGNTVTVEEASRFTYVIK